MTEAEIAVAIFACTSCRAPVTAPCVTAKGKTTTPHAARLRDARARLTLQPEVDRLTTEVATLKDGADFDERRISNISQQLNNATAENATLRARIAELETPAPTDPWQTHHEYDLSNPAGWTINTGARPTVDASTGSTTMVNFGNDGLRCSAKPSGTKILSCDVISKHVPLPTHWAIEMDLQFDGYLGVGMFPAPFWSKAIEGGVAGELDGVEFMGGRLGNPGLDGKMAWKMTAIALPATSPLIQAQEQLMDAMSKLDWFAKHTWRWEKTDGRFEVFIDGTAVAAITRDEFDTVRGSSKGMWDKQFEDPTKHWYTRHTWQVGENPQGTLSKSAGKVPADWTGSSFLISRMVAYVPR